MASDLIKDAIEDVKCFLKSEGIEKYELEVKGQSESGENYLGEIIFIEVTTPNEKDKNYDLVVKTAKRNEALLEKAKTAYDRELFVYTKVFPAYREFLKENHSDIELDFVAKVYWMRGRTLVLENLKTIGFGLHDRFEPWDMKHSSLAMRNYGILHGISLALSIKKPEVFKDLTKEFSNVFVDFLKDSDIQKLYSAPMKDAIKILEDVGRNDLIPKVEKLIDDIPNIIGNEHKENKFKIITHGDCWNNNFLFKYQNGIPSKMVFLDFQMTNYDSPVADLCYNIYVTCDKTCLNNFDLLMKTYYASFSKTAESFGIEQSKIFSFEQLMEQWKKYSKMPLFIGSMVLKFSLLSKEDAPKLEDSVKKNFEDMFDEVVVKNVDEYNRRVKEAFVHYLENFA